MGHSPYEAATDQITWNGIEQGLDADGRRIDSWCIHFTRLPPMYRFYMGRD